MLFNSFSFLIFLPVVFTTYWLLRQKEGTIWQNILLILASYVFYGWWDPRFLLLIVLSSAVDFVAGQLIHDSPTTQKKYWLWMSIAFNLGILGFFKYFNFFVDSFVEAFASLGLETSVYSLQIIIPVGISFYTFQTMSYSLDIYRQQLKPTRDPFAFFAFVAFFPQLVAGPIERASNLLPQFLSKRNFDYTAAADGMRQMLWGFFKKVVIADNCALLVNDIFEHHQSLPGGSLLLGALLFSIQIYCDFSGYSDIAIGCARLFGIQLRQNFAFPYFSRDIGEFWRRWHISLSSWFRDYLYIPLGGSRGSKAQLLRNIFIIFLVSGLWHGANWTYVAWGLLHALLFLPMILLNQHKKHTGELKWASLKTGIQMLSTFLLVSLAWVFFRSENISAALEYYAGLFDASLFTIAPHKLSPLLIWILLMFVFEWLHKSELHGLSIAHWKKPMRAICYLSLTMIIFYFGNFTNVEFIYFAF